MLEIAAKLVPSKAPITEELVFRACMLPLMVPHFRSRAVLYTPLFFGIGNQKKKEKKKK